MGLTTVLAIEALTNTTHGPRRRGPHLDKPDPVLDQLVERGLVYDYGHDGQAFIACPFSGEHTTGTDGDGSTVYLRAGTNGYAQGHFKCSHGHCLKREWTDFAEALDVYACAGEEFEDLTTSSAASLDAPGAASEGIRQVSYDSLGLKRFVSAQKNHPKANGYFEASRENITRVLSEPAALGKHLRYDAFRDEIMWSTLTKPDAFRTFRDVDYNKFMIELERNKILTIPKDVMRDCVADAGDMEHFDSAMLWLNKLVWDGVPRIGNFMADYCGSEDTEYTRAVSVYLWTALAGRCLVPGIQCDMVPIFIGMKQGEKKTSALRNLVPSHEMFAEVDLAERDDNLARMTKGVLVAELGELRGLHTRELEAVKSYITRRHDKWVPKYKELAITYGRRCVFIATSNRDECLVDPTGNRRWLPVKTPRVDRNAIARDREQLWAEGAWLFGQLGGIAWENAQQLAEGVHEKHMVIDPWNEMLEEWYVTPDQENGGCPMDRECLRLREFAQAVGVDFAHLKPNDSTRLGNFARKKQRVHGQWRLEGMPTKGWWLGKG